MEHNISRRKAQILRAVVEEYVKCGEPVGSKYLAKNVMPNCSPATIRNEMAELESLGYLEQPHTSSGRMPSELGYRFYVDCLQSEYQKTKAETETIAEKLRDKRGELKKILSEASKLARSMTNYTAITALARPGGNKILRFEVMYYNSRNIVLVMLTAGGAVKTANLSLPFDILATDAALLSSVLNRHMTNRLPDEITLPVIMKAGEEMGSHSHLLTVAMKEIFTAEGDGGDISVDGVDRLLGYPEFSDVDKLKGLIGAIESKDGILDTISNLAGDELEVIIGKENAVMNMNDSSLVIKKIKKNGKVVGAIGVIGPCRMDYAKVMSTVDALASTVGKMISDETGLIDAPKKRD